MDDENHETKYIPILIHFHFHSPSAQSTGKVKLQHFGLELLHDMHCKYDMHKMHDDEPASIGKAQTLHPLPQLHPRPKLLPPAPQTDHHFTQQPYDHRTPDPKHSISTTAFKTQSSASPAVGSVLSGLFHGSASVFKKYDRIHLLDRFPQG